MREEHGVALLSAPCRNQRTQLPPAIAPLRNRWRPIVETVDDQLTEQFGLARQHAHTCWGLCARLYTKLTAHTLCVYLNRLLGAPACLQIKALAFPAN